MSAPPGGAGRLSAGMLGLVFLALLLVVFAVIYLTAPNPFTALWEMGLLALFVGLGTYLAQALSKDPTVQRSLGWGFGAAGFVLLLGDFWIGPGDPLTTPWRLYLTIPVLILLIVVFGLARWRFTAVAYTKQREARRAEWDRSAPPSAFDYAAAQTPGTTPGGTAPAESAAGPRSP